MLFTFLREKKKLPQHCHSPVLHPLLPEHVVHFQGSVRPLQLLAIEHLFLQLFNRLKKVRKLTSVMQVMANVITGPSCSLVFSIHKIKLNWEFFIFLEMTECIKNISKTIIYIR